MKLLLVIILSLSNVMADDFEFLPFPTDRDWREQESEPEVIHLDIPYLCKWCGIEVIVDPYAEDLPPDPEQDF